MNITFNVEIGPEGVELLKELVRAVKSIAGEIEHPRPKKRYTEQSMESLRKHAAVMRQRQKETREEKAKREDAQAPRDRVIRTCWPTDMPVLDILAAVNALPGEPLTERQLRHRADALGLHRTPVAVPVQRVSTSATLDAVTKRDIPTIPTHPHITVDFDTLRIWAIERGIVVNGPNDLHLVNAKAASLGLPTFRLAPKRGEISRDPAPAGSAAGQAIPAPAVGKGAGGESNRQPLP
jgi:hypothetical protein